MSRDESLLTRWSRLKHRANAEAAERAAAPTGPAASAPSEPLPPLDGLDFSSDFSVFLKGQVEEKLKSAALRKLFHSPHFNQMDGLDVYIDDYSQSEPLGEDMLQQLNQARTLLFPEEQDAHQLARQEDVAGPSGDAPPPSSLPGSDIS